MKFDLMNRIAVKRAISPVSVADNTAQVSQILDMRGQMAACLVIATGSIADADATFAVLLEESAFQLSTDTGLLIRRYWLSILENCYYRLCVTLAKLFPGKE